MQKQDVADLKAMIQNLKEIQALDDKGQLMMMNRLIGLFTAMDQDIMAKAFEIMVELPHAKRTVAIGVFIQGMREGLKDVRR
jgi:hypothetical protein